MIKMEAQVKKVTLRGQNDGDGIVSKRLRIFLSREFDDDMAAMLGSDGQSVLASLRSRGLTRAVLPITAINVQATITGNKDAQQVVIPTVTGVTAAAKWAGSDDDVPTLVLELDTSYARDVLGFLGDHHLAMVGVELQPRQGELNLVAPAETNGTDAPKKNGRRGKAKQGDETTANA
jgi:hypothetical protein